MHYNSLDGMAEGLAQLALGDMFYPVYDAIADRADGVLLIDLIHGKAMFDGAEIPLKKGIADAAAWLAERISGSRETTWQSLEEASVSVALDSTKIPTDRTFIVHYNARAEVTLRTRQKTVSAKAGPSGIWINRSSHSAIP